MWLLQLLESRLIRDRLGLRRRKGVDGAVERCERSEVGWRQAVRRLSLLRHSKVPPAVVSSAPLPSSNRLSPSVAQATAPYSHSTSHTELAISSGHSARPRRPLAGSVEYCWLAGSGGHSSSIEHPAGHPCTLRPPTANLVCLPTERAPRAAMRDKYHGGAGGWSVSSLAASVNVRQVLFILLANLLAFTAVSLLLSSHNSLSTARLPAEPLAAESSVLAAVSALQDNVSALQRHLQQQQQQ